MWEGHAASLCMTNKSKEVMKSTLEAFLDFPLPILIEERPCLLAQQDGISVGILDFSLECIPSPCSLLAASPSTDTSSSISCTSCLGVNLNWKLKYFFQILMKIKIQPIPSKINIKRLGDQLSLRSSKLIGLYLTALPIALASLIVLSKLNVYMFGKIWKLTR